jgi:hypothetical protein
MRTPIPLSTRPNGLLAADLRAELDSFLLSLEAENLAPKTRRTYGEAVKLLGRFLAERGMPTDPRSIRREHLEAERSFRWVKGCREMPVLVAALRLSCGRFQPSQVR